MTCVYLRLLKKERAHGVTPQTNPVVKISRDGRPRSCAPYNLTDAVLDFGFAEEVFAGVLLDETQLLQLVIRSLNLTSVD